MGGHVWMIPRLRSHTGGVEVAPLPNAGEDLVGCDPLWCLGEQHDVGISGRGGAPFVNDMGQMSPVWIPVMVTLWHWLSSSCGCSMRGQGETIPSCLRPSCFYCSPSGRRTWTLRILIHEVGVGSLAVPAPNGGSNEVCQRHPVAVMLEHERHGVVPSQQLEISECLRHLRPIPRHLISMGIFTSIWVIFWW